MSVSSVRVSLAGLLLAGAVLSGCTQTRTHQGYVIDTDLVNSIQPGVDNRQSVLKVLGKPTLTSQFNQGEWFYVSRASKNLAFQSPHAISQITLRIRFNSQGTVTAIDRTGLDLASNVTPYGKKTPTLGRHRGFFEDLFGNIGTVGAPGTGGGGGGGQGGQ